MTTKATPEQIRDLANMIALQAEAISTQPWTNPHALARLLAGNAATLVEWTAPKPAEPGDEHPAARYR